MTNTNSKKRILTTSMLFFLSLLLVLSILPHFVSAGVKEIIPGSGIKSFFAGFVENWKTGAGFSTSVTKLLLTIILAIIIQGLLGFIPGLSAANAGLKWLAAIIVAFLGMAYLTPEEVIILMSSYSAMGFVIGIAIPFLILLAFTYQVAKKLEEGGANAVLQAWFGRIAWLVFAIVMVYHLIRLLSSGSSSSSGLFFWLVVAIALLSVAMFLFYKFILKKMEGMVREQAAQTLKVVKRRTNRLTERVGNVMGNLAKLQSDLGKKEKNIETGEEKLDEDMPGAL